MPGFAIFMLGDEILILIEYKDRIGKHLMPSYFDNVDGWGIRTGPAYQGAKKASPPDFMGDGLTLSKQDSRSVRVYLIQNRTVSSYWQGDLHAMQENLDYVGPILGGCICWVIFVVGTDRWATQYRYRFQTARHTAQMADYCVDYRNFHRILRGFPTWGRQMAKNHRPCANLLFVAEVAVVSVY